MGAPCNGGNRRRFLKSTAVAGAMASTAPDLLLAAQAPSVPLVTLGKTGQKVTRLGMGTSWALSPSFVQRALSSGVRYIDTSESYENTLSEKVIGQVVERMGNRKDLYLVTKNSNGKVGGPEAMKTFQKRLSESLERLRTDYVDAYYLHGVDGGELALLKDPEVRAAFEALKKSGKIRFAGLSCHDALLPEILTTAAEVGWIDQVMIKFNFRDVGGRDRTDDLSRALEKAMKANLGLVAMKTQGGAGNFPERMAELKEKGFKKEVAAVKSVWMDGRMQVVVSEMTNFSDLRENIAASREALTPREARLLEEHRLRTARLYCHGCGHLCETAAHGVPVATVLRYWRYYTVYGKRQEARALFAALPPEARATALLSLDLAERACPHGLPVASLVQEAQRGLS